jgi:hypothetical protein
MFFDATVEAVKRGTFICAAAGNRFGCAGGTDAVTFPAAFPHVLSVTGALADQEPYWQCRLDIYSACKWKIGSDTQLAAYTTNLAKARRGCRATVDQNGDGTSHSTPQAAAAAALYIQKWQLPAVIPRVQAVARALFDGAYKVRPDFFYKGILRAHDSLGISPRFDDAAAGEPEATLSFPLFESLPALEEAAPAARRMLALEALALTARPGGPRELLAPLYAAPARERQQTLVDALLADGGASRALRSHLHAAARVLGVRAAVPVAVAAEEKEPAVVA